MRIFKNMAAQGDMLIRRIEALPKNVKEVASENGKFICAHSETGHNHVVMDRPDVRMYQDTMDEFKAYLVMDTLFLQSS